MNPQWNESHFSWSTLAPSAEFYQHFKQFPRLCLLLSVNEWTKWIFQVFCVTFPAWTVKWSSHKRHKTFSPSEVRSFFIKSLQSLITHSEHVFSLLSLLLLLQLLFLFLLTIWYSLETVWNCCGVLWSRQVHNFAQQRWGMDNNGRWKW